MTACNSANLVDHAGPGMLPKNSEPRLAQVTDGLSNTILYAESAGRPFLYRRNHRSAPCRAIGSTAAAGCAPERTSASMVPATTASRFPAPAPSTAPTATISAAHPFPHPYYGSEGSGEAYAFHPGGANFAFGDGSVRLLSDNISIREFARLVTRDGGEAFEPVTTGPQAPDDRSIIRVRRGTPRAARLSQWAHTSVHNRYAGTTPGGVLHSARSTVHHP